VFFFLFLGTSDHLFILRGQTLLEARQTLEHPTYAKTDGRSDRVMLSLTLGTKTGRKSVTTT